ncbi:hypothetical protein [Acutalibacter muris]
MSPGESVTYTITATNNT